MIGSKVVRYSNALTANDASMGSPNNLGFSETLLSTVDSASSKEERKEDAATSKPTAGPVSPPELKEGLVDDKVVAEYGGGGGDEDGEKTVVVKKPPAPKRRRVQAQYQVRRDISPLVYLKPEARNSNLVQFIELVQGRTQVPMNQLVQEWMIAGGDIDFSALGPILKSAVFSALQDLTNICRKYRRAIYSEQDIIEDASHPYYHSFIELTSAHLLLSSSFSQKGYHPLRDSIKRTWSLATANAIAANAVQNQPGSISGGL